MPSKSEITVAHLYEALSKRKVEYLIVGGMAVEKYGYQRISRGPDGLPTEKQDIDIWYKPTISNYYNLVKVLGDLGASVNELTSGVVNPKKSYLRQEFENFKLDCVPVMIALDDFSKSYADKRIAHFNKIAVPIISYNDLIKNKEAMARAKDLEDIKQLKLKNEPPKNPA